VRTVDERPYKEGNNIGDGKGNLGEVEVKLPDSEGCSEGHHPIGIHDGEGETPERGSALDHAAIRLDVRSFFSTREQLPQYNGAVVGDSDEKQEGCNQPPDLIGILCVVTACESLVHHGSGHPWELKEMRSGGMKGR